MTKTRTAAVTILAILAALAGISAGVDVLRFLGILPIAVLGPLRFFDVSILGALLSGVVALIWFSTARQLWNLDPRGWLFVITIALLNLIFLAIAVLGQTSFSAVLPSMLLSLAALVLALLPSTKAAFGQP